ncbi:L-serine dehydratase [Cyphellophora attinorum]|uniref:L-serine dehydratase n=1 Tax=Cyphellophora attinorum TaxID=1664694 RepID=A0A0N0NNN4_9EURO|nr:L-serine dehydratase [Phialophora attinorum]KPI41748.1 L-serine dehydratase [Phialophora attinorum]
MHVKQSCPQNEPIEVQHAQPDDVPPGDSEHAIISAFDLFSIGIGPSSSHTVGPMRAGNIFVTELADLGLLTKVRKIRIAIYGSLALTGEGHMTPSALLLGLEGANVESVDTAYVPVRFNEIKTSKKLRLGAGEAVQEVDFIYDKDFVWEWTKKLPQHSNGLRLTVFDENGDPLASNDLFSIGGGFVVNSGMTTQANHAAKNESQTSTSHHPADLRENLYYKAIKKSEASEERRSGAGYDFPDATSTGQSSLVTRKPDDLNVGSFDGSSSGPYPAPLLFRNANHLLALCNQHNLTIAQLMFENEKALGMTETEIFDKLFRIWEVMDDSIREGVSASAPILPGSLKLRRRAPGLYRKLTRGLYPEHTQPPQLLQNTEVHALPVGNSSTAIEPTTASAKTPAVRRRGMGLGRRTPPVVHGSPIHPISVSPVRSATLPAMDYLTVYAIAVNETNAAGGRVVTAPTNGAAGIIPAVLKYIVEFVSDDPERDVPIFLLTAAAIASLFKRGATISAAEGGCMAEVGVACSMAAGAYAAVWALVLKRSNKQLRSAPCIERNALGAVKALTAANLALNGDIGQHKVSLDDAIRAMRVTAKGMKDEFKETSLSGLATSVPLNIPVSVPDC